MKGEEEAEKKEEKEWEELRRRARGTASAASLLGVEGVVRPVAFPRYRMSDRRPSSSCPPLRSPVSFATCPS